MRLYNSTFSSIAKLVFLASGLLSLTACQGIYKGAGSGIQRYTTTNIVPYVAASTDIGQACQMATSMTPVLFSFERVGTRLNESRVLMSMLSGHCATQQAWSAQLAYTAAIYQQLPAAALDARIVEKRALVLAAQRYWIGYQAKRAAFSTTKKGYTSAFKNFGYKNESSTSLKNVIGKCQKMDTSQQMILLAGMLDGLLAVMSDSLAERAANIPLSVIGEITEDAHCLNSTGLKSAGLNSTGLKNASLKSAQPKNLNAQVEAPADRWWGMSIAVPAMLTALKSGDPTPYLPQLQQASLLGFQQGVRLASVLEANIYVTQGNDSALKAAIRRFVGDTPDSFTLNPQYALFDAAAVEHMQAMSDQLWMRAKGHRTPVGQLGKFWDDKPVPVMNDMDLSEFL